MSYKNINKLIDPFKKIKIDYVKIIKSYYLSYMFRMTYEIDELLRLVSRRDMIYNFISSLFIFNSYIGHKQSIVRQTLINNRIIISTVYLPLMININNETPQIFETMIFTNHFKKSFDYQWRYSNYRDAKKHHKYLCRNYKKFIKRGINEYE